MEFVVDMPSLIKLDSSATTQTTQNPTGIYTISLTSNSDITKINEAVTISIPTVDETNSFQYMDLLKSVAVQAIKEGWNSIDGKWYYGDSNGSRKTSWVKADNKWYYLENNGEMQT